ncbi:MAG: ribosome maturation factor RimP [Actinomycetota bacterium]
MRWEDEMDVEALVRPLVESSGLELVEVTLRKEGGRRVLRVTVDREGGVDLDTIAAASERISRRLDIEEVSPGPYSLEVSSPGIERPLRSATDFERKVGEKVRVKVLSPEPATFMGRLIVADAEGIVVDAESGEVRITYGDVASARTVFEWGGKHK